MKTELIKQIHDILGILDPPELRDIKTKRIILAFARTFNHALYDNTLCTPMCDGFHRYENFITELCNDDYELLTPYYCTSCFAMFKEECCCNQDDDEEYYSTIADDGKQY